MTRLFAHLGGRNTITTLSQEEMAEVAQLAMDATEAANILLAFVASDILQDVMTNRLRP